MGFWDISQSIASILGGAAGVAAMVGSAVTVRRARDRRRIEAEEARRQAARLVTADIVSEPNVHWDNDHLPRPANTSPREYDQVIVQVDNHGGEPISSVMVFLPERALPLHFGTIGPGQSKRNGWLDAPELWHVMHIGPGCPGHAWHLDLEFVFTDNRGARWRRNGEQEPVRLLPSDDVVEDWKRRQEVIEEERRLANERLAADPDVNAV
ncbi:hypothetical protein [Micromonospora sp. WMMD987]|uniref:hypothetical protein n=1 Tax=Micromonospora sp. WMMD987 TaxID=3016089 RepID=UPI00249ACB15|nr:hypothetical protein [Micromonospora sp. WMMD987]WFE94877.1 hypothetical protein O7612_26720 [Micromonospora sp. WMMD987]